MEENETWEDAFWADYGVMEEENKALRRQVTRLRLRAHTLGGFACAAPILAIIF